MTVHQAQGNDVQSSCRHMMRMPSPAVQRLKFRLLAEGMTVDPEARRVLSGQAGDWPLTLADYASTSGVALELAEHTWVNVPIPDHNAELAARSSLCLRWQTGGFFISDAKQEHSVFPRLPPSYHDQVNSLGVRYTDYAITHTDRVRISPIQGCSYTCQFCDLPYKRRYQLMDSEGCIDAIRLALKDKILPARHVLISGGVPKPEDWARQHRLYEEVVQAFPNIQVDVMMVASPNHWDLHRMKQAGVHAVSINLELFNFEGGRRLMPRKTDLARTDWLRFIEQAVGLFGPGRVRSLLMVGLESAEMTLQGVWELAMRGCDPVLSPFRPDPATPLAHHPAPSSEIMTRIYHEAYEITEQLGVKLGPRCVPCMHNTLTFPDGSGAYYHSTAPEAI
ncbi:MAG: radical SAM protein [Magnetococcales bacterium]|nr:radical SAM protein [Magnetococcales bacterium]